MFTEVEMSSVFGLNIIWQQVISKIDSYLSTNSQQASYRSYFDGTELVDLDESKAVITTPLNVNKIVLSDEEISSMIRQAFQEVMGKDVVCKIEKAEEWQKKEIETAIEKELNDNIIEEFTFDNFVVGQSNIEARTAALAVAREPGKNQFNPLVIYGSSGLGKTHLMSAIGNYIKENDIDRKLLYISSADLVKEVSISTREDRLSEYKNQLNSLDVLLVDDIQNLSNKPGTQNVFFDIYNELYNNHKQIVLTSDRPPYEIKDIEDRLKTRFSQGLSVTILPLENETAYRILQMKLKNHKLDEDAIQPEVLSYIANNYSSDVRSLEGALNRLLFYSINFSNSDVIDINLAHEAFKDQPVKKKNDKSLEAEDIVKAVANYYGLTDRQLKSKVRTKNIANARHIAMYLCRKHLNISQDDVGKLFGGRDHSTVLAACDKIEKLQNSDKLYKKVISDIENSFK